MEDIFFLLFCKLIVVKRPDTQSLVISEDLLDLWTVADAVLDDVLEVVLTSNHVASSVRTACTESLGKTSACSTLWSRPSLGWGA